MLKRNIITFCITMLIFVDILLISGRDNSVLGGTVSSSNPRSITTGDNIFSGENTFTNKVHINTSTSATIDIATSTVNGTTTINMGRIGTKGTCLNVYAVNGNRFNLVFDSSGGFVSSTGACQ